ncbi:hypothetical protein Ade02nite_10090 [Paractinoplanes deccanensis]|uniref:Uncharacterized protein n=2 Tax=Paractinoplanes deccanensis TaxID=113561 RepID=A0ABQ3XXA0_9ACTN|nr:hypothetical protein Ade02nite_10090 [Actinoplanes deccanensis]
MYHSKYDPNPLQDPGNGDGGDGGGQEVDPSKHLQVNWQSPQPLHTSPPPSPSSSSSAGDGGKDGGKDSAKDQPNQLIPKIPTPGDMEQWKLENFGPEWELVHVRPDDLLVHEQHILDAAKSLAAAFNALADTSEASLDAPFWGLGEGYLVTANHAGRSADGWEPYTQYTDSAVATRDFVRSLRSMQRAALQHAADCVTVSGGFIELLNASADAYAQSDQHSVFPDKASLPQDNG